MQPACYPYPAGRTAAVGGRPNFHSVPTQVESVSPRAWPWVTWGMLVTVVALTIATLSVGIVTLQRADTLVSDVSPTGDVVVLHCTLDWLNIKLTPTAPATPENVPIFVYDGHFYANAALTAYAKSLLSPCDMRLHDTLLQDGGTARAMYPSAQDSSKVMYVLADDDGPSRRGRSLNIFGNHKKGTSISGLKGTQSSSPSRTLLGTTLKAAGDTFTQGFRIYKAEEAYKVADGLKDWGANQLKQAGVATIIVASTGDSNENAV